MDAASSHPPSSSPYLLNVYISMESIDHVNMSATWWVKNLEVKVEMVKLFPASHKAIRKQGVVGVKSR